MKTLTPCLWFDDKALEAARFYVSVFPKSKLGRIAHYFDGGPRPKEMVMTVEFELNGQPFLALNGGPQFQFSPAVSFIIYCRTQSQIDRYWDKLGAGGEGQCGWLTDRFGVSWQVVPVMLDDWIKDGSAGTNRMMKALMGMKKLDIAELKRAYKG
jgi:predicted 3-demethylubiquinone-9 3-methyltransferase (glyoxalase superfamily)